MKKKIYDTIIIGCGVSGLGCAHTLKNKNKDFLIITEDIGGRICTSSDGKVNYGACFVLDNYHHVLHYVTKCDKIHPFGVEFHGKSNSHYFMAGIMLYPLQLFRLMRLLLKFRKEYEKFKLLCEIKSQKEIIEANEFLHKLYHTDASDFVKQEDIEGISYKYLGEPVYLCTFLPLSNVSAFDFMRVGLNLFISGYEFEFNKEKAIAGFEDKIVTGSVKKLIIKNTRNPTQSNPVQNNIPKLITSKGKTYYAKNIVVATQPHISKRLLKLKAIKEPASAYLFHITGELKNEWHHGQFELFGSDSSIISIMRQPDRSYLLYSKISAPSIADYFENYSLISKKTWKPAFNISGDVLLDAVQGKNLYMIGDHNIGGMEDSYITGIYAANQIITNDK